MTPQMALDLAYLTILTATKMCLPVLATAIIIGIVVNIVQTVTSIRDMSLTFVPKFVAAGIVMALTLPWMIQTMTGFFTATYMMFGQMTP